MSFQDPPTLLQLAIQSLVRDEVVAISALPELPMEIFPRLLKEANTQRRTRVVKAVVADWPLSFLPFGSFIKNPSLEIYQAMLDGLDTWLKRKIRPGGQKLQKVDLRKVYHDLWGAWAGDHSAETVPGERAAKRQRYALRQPLKMVIDLCLRHPLDVCQTYLLQWVEDRKCSLELCCGKMEIGALKVSEVVRVLKLLQPECIKELELNTEWNLSTLAHFAPCISQMCNLEKLTLGRVIRTASHQDGESSTRLEEKRVAKVLSLFPKLNRLQRLTLNDTYFLRDHLKQLFRCLKTPLESLIITICPLSQSDLESFAECQSLCQLKYFYMRRVNLKHLHVMPLRLLLESVAGTLQTLKLKACEIEASHLRLLLPALSQCSQLTRLSFYDNDIPMAALKDLLCHTANLSQLTKERYPVPIEVYNDLGYVQVDMFSQSCAELVNTIIPVRQPKSICFRTKSCSRCGDRYFYDLKITLCSCRGIFIVGP